VQKNFVSTKSSILSAYASKQRLTCNCHKTVVESTIGSVLVLFGVAGDAGCICR